jgi:diketogulonate reductase-like aldo/keto reductase
MLPLSLRCLALAAAIPLVASQKLESISPKAPINEIPILGLGTYLLNLSPQNASDAIAGAMEIGYRHFDTAAVYLNEKMLAPGFKEGLRRTKMDRSEIWVTSKLWNNRCVFFEFWV